ncbi:hypothetical protein Nepgr_023239 [Nepenthes gracilis]|uniref:Uncharacterized protein n=1 Tax=Nepenthes gracilis TaxID=150966 RepID=A0AAD3T278_NEPGR|nr:hypothetical protein Nepgr_023239 [Nepenthes gracilis]
MGEGMLVWEGLLDLREAESVWYSYQLGPFLSMRGSANLAQYLVQCERKFKRGIATGSSITCARGCRYAQPTQAEKGIKGTASSISVSCEGRCRYAQPTCQTVNRRKWSKPGKAKA